MIVSSNWLAMIGCINYKGIRFSKMPGLKSALVLCIRPVPKSSLLAQSHNAICFKGFFTQKQYKLFTLGTVSCFSEKDIHCFYVNNLPQRIALWDCASGE